MRCDKQHPHCSRCIRIGSTCRYSVSMRTGRPTIEFVKALNAGMLLMPPHQSAQTTIQGARVFDSDQSLWAALQAGQSQSSRSTTGSSTESSTPPASDSALFTVPVGPVTPIQDREVSGAIESGPPDSSYTFPAMPTAQIDKTGVQSGQSTDSSSQNPIDITNIMDYLYTSADDFTGIEPQSRDGSHSTPLAMDFDYFSQFDFLDPEPPSNSEVTTPISIVQDLGLIPIDPALQQLQTPQHGHSCLRLAKTLKESVILLESRGGMMQREHDMPDIAPPITTDQALMICSTISKQLIEMLQCRCQTDSYLPFLITVIISKVLATYGAIAKVDASTLFKFGSSPQIQTAQEKAQNQEQQRNREREQEQQQDAFVAVPLRLGAYDVDGELEVVLRARLVLHELSKLECVVQLFAEKYCQGGAEEKSREDGTIFSALGQFIKHRYAKTKAACEVRSPFSRHQT